MEKTVPTFAQLKAQHTNQHISYQMLLETQEWKSKRDVIVKRDEGKCTKCGCSPTDNVWHNGKMHYLLSVPRVSDELVEIGGFMYKGEEIGDEIYELGGAVVLHVHHQYYIKSKHPWEYVDEALITLCNDCHLEVHKTTAIPVYKLENGNRIGVPVETCSRCHGAGYFPQYKKVSNGVCFKCDGARYTNLTL